MIHFECEARPFMSHPFAGKEEFNQNFNYRDVNECNKSAIFSSLLCQ